MSNELSPLPQQLPDQQSPLVDAFATTPHARAAARLLEYQRDRFVAFAAHATVELIENPPLIPVPGAPYYCRGLMAWQGQHIPLIDLQTLLRAYPTELLAKAPVHVLVVAFQRAPYAPLEYGALCAPSLVRMVQVTDDQACALPQDSDLWHWIAASCFSYVGHAVPILDVAKLFTQSPL